MAIGDPYLTLPELKSYLKIVDTADDAELDSALAAVSRGIDEYCGRQFNTDGIVLTRSYEARRAALVDVDDFHTLDGLEVEVDTSRTGSWAVRAASRYEPRPLDGVVDGVPGWPYYQLKAVYTDWPITGRASVRVTAVWGWAVVPDPVRQACRILASEAFKMKDAPFGVAGFADYGAVRVRKNPVACQMLNPYRRYPVKAG
ncbi:phage gp6-like head-tail connector protein [Nonomuraea mesophila]|uniref:Phage gp6-like head-tail connector protein n=1 Tax=Nonomuraea mesophila TaxID=2530382 RepID=A0A4R5EZS1_9ACTN|nr:head-tail connector protein [Nonomuraea mesophila]TDE40502.1 phage gp6-like head-tail connector protein [Nonomuraea mesophila]